MASWADLSRPRLTNATIANDDDFLVRDRSTGTDSLITKAELATSILTGGSVTGLTELQVDNININANTISTTNTNGNLTLSPNGTGDVVVTGDLAVDTNTLFVDAVNNRVNIGNTNGTRRLSVQNTALDTEGIALYRNTGDGTLMVGLAQNADGNGQIRVNNTSGVRTVQLSAGNTISYISEGRTLFGTTTDNGVDRVQVNGSAIINPTTGAATLNIVSANSFSGVQITSPNTSFNYINFGDPEDGNVGQIQYNHATDLMSFKTADVQRFSIDNAGVAYPTGGIRLGGAGAANLLNRWETGTWTPVISSGITGTVSVISGRYTKIGELVAVYLDIQGTGMDIATTAEITGLPFSTPASGAFSVPTRYVTDSIDKDGGNVGVYLTTMFLSTLESASTTNIIGTGFTYRTV